MCHRIKIFFFIFLSTALRVSAQNLDDTIIIFYFPVNSYQLAGDQVNNLRSLIPQINRVEAVEGYADSTGSLVYNRHLSQLRADEIFRILKSMNFRSQATPIGKGEAFNNSDLSKNRKVEITISLRPKSTSEREKPKNDTVVSVLSIDNIYFVPDKPEIEASSYLLVQNLASTLKKYKEANFEIIGHVNYQSNRDSSHVSDMYRLSYLRAKRIYEMLISEGIPSSRMSYKGVGNSQPLIRNPKNDDERRKNMRVEIRILNYN